MKTVITTEHGKSVTDLVKVQDTGKASLVKILNALGISDDEWKQTTLQITAFAISTEDTS
jgi:hypothetical protein